MICRKCNIDKDIASFRTREGKPITSCRDCENEYQRDYYNKHLSVTRERKRLWMEQHRRDPQNRERIKQRQREAWKSGRPKLARASYYATLQERHFFAYRALRWNAHYASRGERITPNQLASLWRIQRGRCALTGRKLDRTAHLDHIHSIAQGGPHNLANLRWLDPKVNLARRALSDAEFLSLCSDVVRWIGERIEALDHATGPR